MNKFAQSAKSATSLSEIMENRETKMEIPEIIKQFPDGITLTEFDYVTVFDQKKGCDVTFPVFAFSECPTAFFFGGCVLDKIAREWAGSCGGDIHAASDELLKCGGVKIRMEQGKTKSGNSVTTVTVLG